MPQALQTEPRQYGKKSSGSRTFYLVGLRRHRHNIALDWTRSPAPKEASPEKHSQAQPAGEQKGNKTMTPTRKRRLIAVLLILAGVGIASTVAFYSLQQNLLYFQSPSEIAEQAMPAGRQFRLGGLVKTGSVERAEDGLAVDFTVTDGLEEISVRYVGILPDLFREGQGVIARGALNESGLFQASEVLAKHDENYMPPEVADALEKAGHPRSENKGADYDMNEGG
jgi:cytochrome c-type biogenesis protein CcmE